MSNSKRYKNSLEKFDPDGFLSGREALEVVKSFERTKFDESIDLVVRLGVDPRKTEEMIRSTVALPSGSSSQSCSARSGPGDRRPPSGRRVPCGLHRRVAVTPPPGGSDRIRLRRRCGPGAVAGRQSY